MATRRHRRIQQLARAHGGGGVNTRTRIGIGLRAGVALKRGKRECFCLGDLPRRGFACSPPLAKRGRNLRVPPARRVFSSRRTSQLILREGSTEPKSEACTPSPLHGDETRAPRAFDRNISTNEINKPTRGMAPPDAGQSITSIEQTHTALREATRDFLIKARRMIASNTPLERYYHIEINSQLQPDKDDTEAILRLSKNSATCARCGSRKTLRVKRRQRVNQTWTRRHCRHLKGILIVDCAKCHDKTQYKLRRRAAICNSIKEETQPKRRAHKDPISTQPTTSQCEPRQPKVESQSPPQRLIKLPGQNKPPKTKPSSKNIKPQPGHVKKQPIKQMVKRKSRSTVKQTDPIEQSASQTKRPQFSSRLRAFTCLLKP